MYPGMYNIPSIRFIFPTRTPHDVASAKQNRTNDHDNLRTLAQNAATGKGCGMIEIILSFYNIRSVRDARNERPYYIAPLNFNAN